MRTFEENVTAAQLDRVNAKKEVWARTVFLTAYPDPEGDPAYVLFIEGDEEVLAIADLEGFYRKVNEALQVYREAKTGSGAVE